VYPTIKTIIGTMLLSKTSDEWENAYECASEIRVSRPQMKSALNDIYNATEQYAVFFFEGLRAT
jgi:hypothetical protein